MVDQIESVLETASGLIWGKLLIVALLGTGLYLMIGLRAMPLRRIGYAFRRLWQGRRSREGESGDISAFAALMTSMSATIGTGNIAGVATAIAAGGPGAVFWMWITALVGMATKYAEAVLAVKYREVDEEGRYVGGPMYYIKNGLGKHWAWLGGVFAFVGMITAFGIGNAVQSNAVADVMAEDFYIPVWLTGLVLAALAFVVLIGGIRRIAEVASRLVPVMGVFYILGALGVLVWNAEQVPAAFATIFSDAFTGTAATGGFAGAAVMAAIRFGVARGIFSNEAGLGTAPIAHAAARTRDPVRQGTIAMLGTFIDTLIVCTMTALVIVVSGVWKTGDSGPTLTAAGFAQGLPIAGNWIVSLGLPIFAFSTLIAWSYYGERCAEYLFGVRVITPYRLLWTAVVAGGAMVKLNIVWLFSDVMNGLMALPNLVALVLLSPVVFRVTRTYFSRPSGD